MKYIDIVKALKVRFPRCEVSEKQDYIGIYFESVGDELYLFMGQNGMVDMGVAEHAKAEDFKPSGYNIKTFRFSTVASLLVECEEGARAMLKKHKEFEKECNDALADWGMKNDDGMMPDVSPELEAEIMVGKNEVLLTSFEREAD